MSGMSERVAQRYLSAGFLDDLKRSIVRFTQQLRGDDHLSDEKKREILRRLAISTDGIDFGGSALSLRVASENDTGDLIEGLGDLMRHIRVDPEIERSSKVSLLRQLQAIADKARVG